MNTASISALHHLVSQVVGRKALDDTSTDAFAVPASTNNAVPAVNSVTQDSGNTQKDATFDEAFAKMLVNLKAATQTSDSDTSSYVAASDTSLAAKDSAVTSEAELASAVASTTSGTSSTGSSARQEFMDYMSQTPAEKMLEKLTGVSKAEYDAMTPDEKLALDKKVQATLKEQQETATADINSKILAARLALV